MYLPSSQANEWPNMVVELLKNRAMGISAIRALRLRRGRTAMLDSASFQATAQNFETQFAFYSAELGSFGGMNIVEVGPGDVVVNGLRFLLDGAAGYVAWDRFLGDISG